MSWTWTCDSVTGVCTLSSDMIEYLTLLLQVAFTLWGVLLAAIVVLSVAIVFFVGGSIRG